jgi:hypothetical protein
MIAVQCQKQFKMDYFIEMYKQLVLLVEYVVKFLY